VIDDRRFSRADEIFTEDATVDFREVGACVSGSSDQGVWRKTLSIEVIHLPPISWPIGYTDLACRADKTGTRPRHIAVRVTAPTVPEN